MASLFECIAAGRDALVQGGISPTDAPLDAEILARHVLGWDRTTLVTRGREEPPAHFGEPFRDLIRRRLHHEPVAQIVGHREFWGLEFEVTPDVLVPRPETELIVEVALEEVDRTRSVRIADVGTGSGCLAVSLAVELPLSRLMATDVSEAALAVARRNGVRHAVGDRIEWRRGNLLDVLGGPYDLIVSNPPYVPAGEQLPPDVARYEPPAALFSGPDGLDALRVLIGHAATHLTPDGFLIVEFGFGQAEAVKTLATTAGWRRIVIRKDLQGIERTALLKRLP